MSARLPTIFLLAASLLLPAGYAHAQQHLQGAVSGEAGQPVEGATVQLLDGRGGRMLSYALTNEQGAFSLNVRQPSDSLHVTVSALGYRTHTQAARAGESLLIRLEQQAFSLREVEVRPGRVYGRRDTLNYDVAGFLSPRDESIKDVIRKLPGVDVDELGKISYNGKEISKFYVEGMDLVEGRYNQVTNNLRAGAVETVQILENHQPIRILQDKVKTEDIALNLKLRPEFRDKWMVSLKGGAGASPLLWTAGLNAMQLSRQSQSSYQYKGDHSGHDLSDEQLQLFDNSLGQTQEPPTLSFLAQPSLSAPLKRERLLFNHAHTLSANRLYKLNETTRLRLSASLAHDSREQERGSETVYYRAGDSLRIAEQSHTRLHTNQAELAMNIENNATDYYLTNRFRAFADLGRSRTDYSGNLALSQEIQTTAAGLRNEYKRIRTRGDYTLETHSLLRYHHLPASLRIDDYRQELPLEQLYAAYSRSLHRKRGAIDHQYAAGATAQGTKTAKGFSLYLRPSWQWNTSSWRASLRVPLVWTAFPGAAFSRLSANPSLSLQYKPNYAWRFSLSGSYSESYDELTALRETPYLTDYRTRIVTNAFLPVQQQQVYTLYGEYKRTVQEFFATLSLTYMRQQSNRLYEQTFEDGMQTLRSHALPNAASAQSLRGTLSKGFYDWGMKASLTYQLSRSRGEQRVGEERLPFRSDRLLCEPKLSWTPMRRMEIAYQSEWRYGTSLIGGQRQLAPLWEVVRKLSIAWQVSDVSLSAGIDHYRNDLSSGQSVENFFADLGLRWHTGRWQWEASATNLFDKRSYTYTEYTSLQSYTSRLTLRPREYLLTARYTFR
jgi:hypothetical protein